jgi:DNA-binding MarR family transcriptional regulator
MDKDLQVGNPYGLGRAPGAASALAAPLADLDASGAASAGSAAPAVPVTSGHAGPRKRAAATRAPIDPNSDLDPLERRAWRAFLSKHAHIARHLEADLVARSDLPLAEFDVLFQLGLSEDRRLRMNELAERVLLSRAGITRLVDRLVADGLVTRLRCASDARGFFAVLTERGQKRLDEATPGHLAAVKHYFLASFSRSELETLADLMERPLPTE